MKRVLPFFLMALSPEFPAWCHRAMACNLTRDSARPRRSPPNEGQTFVDHLILRSRDDNQDGVVYDKKLGKSTVGDAMTMTEFNPDKIWTAVI
jgi:hypothetical protein